MRKDYEMGSFVYEQSHELFAHTSHPYVDPKTVYDYIEDFTHQPEEQINSLFEKCKLVVRQPVSNIVPPQLPLTKRAYDFGVVTEPKAQISSAELSQHICLEAEPRLWRSITLLQRERRARELPAAILFDIDDEPCGYQKHNGAPAAYFWRDAIVSTDAGNRMVPGDSFINFDYPPDGDPRLAYSALDLVALRKTLPTKNMSFMRFSSANLPTDIREEAFGCVIAGQEGLAEYEDETITFTPEDVRDAVVSFLKDGKAYLVG